MKFKQRLAYFYPFKKEVCMIQLEGRVHAVMFIALAIAGISSCAQMAGEPEVRLQGRFYSGGMGRFGQAPAYFVTFNEPCFIRRIVIHTNRPVKNIDIYVRVEPENWKLVEQFKNPIDAATRINIATRGDAIRVVQKSVTAAGSYWRRSSEAGFIQDIEAFGSSR